MKLACNRFELYLRWHMSAPNPQVFLHTHPCGWGPGNMLTTEIRLLMRFSEDLPQPVLARWHLEKRGSCVRESLSGADLTMFAPFPPLRRGLAPKSR